MSCLHHCRDWNSLWVLSNKPSFGSPSLHKWGNKVLNLCSGMQLGCAPGSTLNLHHHGTSFTWHSDGHVCDDLRPIVWICVSIQPLQGLTLSIGALRHFTMNCKARKPVVRTFLLRSWKDRLWWYITLFLSLATRCSCYFWWDRVFHRHCIRILLRRLLWGLLLLVLTVAHHLCPGHCSSPWNHVSAAVTSCFGEGSVPSWLQPWNDKQLWNDWCLCTYRKFSHTQGSYPAHEICHICHNVGHYYRGHWAIF